MNDTTKWIMIALLLLLIAAAVIVLLRSPGKDRDGGDETIDRVDDDRDAVQAGREDRLAGTSERGVYDQEADERGGGAHPVVQDDRDTRPEPSTDDRPADEDRPVVDEAPSQEPPAAAVTAPAASVDDNLTYADDIEATTGREAAADRDATGEDDVAAEPYQPAAGAYEGGEPGTAATTESHRGDEDPGARPESDADQPPTEELTAGDTEGYGGPATVADTTPTTEPVTTSDDARPGSAEVTGGAGDDSDRLTEAARIGALGAAGGTAAGTAGTREEGFGSGATVARPLSDEEVSAGGRHEPVEEKTDDERRASDRTDSASDREPLTADEVVAASEGDRTGSASTTGPTTATTAAGARGAGYETVDQDEVDSSGAGAGRGDTAETAPVFAESMYGPGSADPLDDGTGPAGWAVKGNVGSMLFHTTDSPSYDAVRAEVWFESEQAARDAGFAHWDRRRR